MQYEDIYASVLALRGSLTQSSVQILQQIAAISDAITGVGTRFDDTVIAINDSILARLRYYELEAHQVSLLLGQLVGRLANTNVRIMSVKTALDANVDALASRHTGDIVSVRNDMHDANVLTQQLKSIVDANVAQLRSDCTTMLIDANATTETGFAQVHTEIAMLRTNTDDSLGTVMATISDVHAQVNSDIANANVAQAAALQNALADVANAISANTGGVTAQVAVLAEYIDQVPLLNARVSAMEASLDILVDGLGSTVTALSSTFNSSIATLNAAIMDLQQRVNATP